MPFDVYSRAGADAAFATAAQGELADTATQPGDLGTAAAADAEDFATAETVAAMQATIDGLVTPTWAALPDKPDLGAQALYYANVYDGFFLGRNSTEDTSTPTIWANTTHLTDAGLRSWADYVMATKKPDGTPVITGTAPKVVWIGDSWIDQGDDTPILHDAVTAVIPGATVIVKGIGGQTSTQVLARFDADVPADADFVIFNEPGVNDSTINGGPENGLGVEGQLDNLREWERKVRAIGAVSLWTGHVPLTDWPRSADYHQRLAAIVGDGAGFPATAPGSSWSANVRQPLDTAGAPTSIGYGPALSAAGAGTFGSGVGLTAAGVAAGAALTTGNYNTAVGYAALGTATTAVDNTAVGTRALTAATGAQNTAVGSHAGAAVTTGTLNTLVGLNAGYLDPTLSTANAITDGTENTLIGNWAGVTAHGDYCATAIGSRAKATIFATAIGTGTQATHMGSVAIGVDSTGTAAQSAAANFIALGTANHTVHVTGKLRIDRNQTTVGAAGGAAAPPATPTRYASVVGSDGVEYVVALYAKA